VAVVVVVSRRPPDWVRVGGRRQQVRDEPVDRVMSKGESRFPRMVPEVVGTTPSASTVNTQII
jgi:hypothetical protein